MERLTHLSLKHKELDAEIHALEKIKPEFMSTEQEVHLHDLKKRKLRIKDELVSLRKELGLPEDTTPEHNNA